MKKIIYLWTLALLFSACGGGSTNGGEDAEQDNDSTAYETAEEPEAEMVETEVEWEIIETERGAIRYVGMRTTVAFDDMGDHFQEHMPKVGMAAGAVMTGPPAGIFWTWDEENKESDMAVVATVAEGEVEGMEIFEIEGGKALMLAYYGAYDASYDAHMAINEHMEDNGMEMRDVVIEEYMTDPSNEPDTTKWLTNIYYMVK